MEAERLSAYSGRKMAAVAHPIKHGLMDFLGDPCPFLFEDKCSVHEVRPFACRTHRSFDSDSYWLLAQTEN